MTARRSAVILAGGLSRRMGTDKALLEFRGATLLERALGVLAARFDALHVSVGRGGAPDGVRAAVERFERGADRRVRIVQDRLGGVGPLAGIHAALEAIDGDRAFFVAVDLPRLSLPLIDLLWERSAEDGCLGCLPSLGGRLQPACAVYHRALAERIPPLIASGRRRLRELGGLESVRIVDLDEPWWRDRAAASGEDAAAGPAALEGLFRNINTPEDYQVWAAEEGLSEPPADRARRSGRKV